MRTIPAAENRGAIILHTFRPAGPGTRRRPICFRVSSFISSCALCTGLVCFVRIQDEGVMYLEMLRENYWHGITRNFGMGELRGSGGRAAALANFRVVVLGLENR